MATMMSRKRLQSVAGDVQDSVSPAAEIARDKLISATEQARASVGPALERVGPALADARDLLAPKVEDARQALAPVASEAVTRGRQQGYRAAVRLGIVEEPKSSHKVRNLLIVLGLGGLVAVAYKKWYAADSDPAWISGRDTAAAGGRLSEEGDGEDKPGNHVGPDH
ncbi:MAG: hypothetical protein ACRDPG_01530 [Nocardioidaceae bacterium]